MPETDKRERAKRWSCLVCETIAECNGPVNEHQIIVSPHREDLNTIEAEVRRRFSEPALSESFDIIEIDEPERWPASLSEFWLRISVALEQNNRKANRVKKGKARFPAYIDAEIEAGAFSAATDGKRTIVLVKRAYSWFEAIAKADLHSSLRRTLQTENAFILVGLTTTWPTESHPEAPLFQSMRVRYVD